MKVTRDNVGQVALQQADLTQAMLLELPTGFGKTKIAVDILSKLSIEKGEPLRVMIFVAKIVHKQLWVDEIKKWYKDYGGHIGLHFCIECYESMKNFKNCYFDVVILDEAHHVFTDKRIDVLRTLTIKRMLLGLSATLSWDMKEYFRNKYKALVLSIPLSRAIGDDVLPEPQIHLVPLEIDSITASERIVINKNVQGAVTSFNYNDSGWRNEKYHKCVVICTQKQKLEYLNAKAQSYNNKYMIDRKLYDKNMWLHFCLERLHWLSETKTPIIRQLMEELKDNRMLVFCSSIEQTESLGCHCINSKDKHSTKNLELFNSSRINQIASCNILNEGVNLVDCRIGIFANISASERMQRQRLGRLLRHPNPIIIMLYYKDTREEELVGKMTKEYDEKYIHRHDNFNLKQLKDEIGD